MGKVLRVDFGVDALQAITHVASPFRDKVAGRNLCGE
jgi:hypothetical protein